MRVLLYRGTTLVSRLIQWQTRSVYSHVGIMLPDGSVIEAWAKGGVVHSPAHSPYQLHKKGTVIDHCVLWERVPLDVNAVSKFLFAQVGRKYDWRGVFGFTTRVPAEKNGKWFCSELVSAALRAGGVNLLAVEPEYASPRDVGASPLLTLSWQEEA